MASIPCTVQLSSSRPATSRKSPRTAAQPAQGQGKGEAGALLGALGDVQTDGSPTPRSDAGKAKKKGNLRGVEVADVNVERSAPSTSRLRWFGFPKLSVVFPEL